ncbi:MAG: DUF4233 domain-containing protein [Candidatus Nanopelagicales bacterium]|jgi:hypothetical protein
MKVLCSSVLGMEILVVLLATSLATSTGAVSNVRLAWGVGLAIMVLLALAIGTLRSPWGLTVGWVMQVLVLATALVAGWSMLVIGLVFAVLWGIAIHLGHTYDRAAAAEAATDDPA